MVLLVFYDNNLFRLSTHEILGLKSSVSWPCIIMEKSYLKQTKIEFFFVFFSYHINFFIMYRNFGFFGSSVGSEITEV